MHIIVVNQLQLIVIITEKSLMKKKENKTHTFDEEIKNAVKHSQIVVF